MEWLWSNNCKSFKRRDSIMSDKITLTDEEKERLKKAAPYLKNEQWDEAFEQIANSFESGWSDCPIHILAYLKYIGIDLMHKITRIPDEAFQGCMSLHTIEIPNNIKEIGWGAFSCCEGLIKVTIPESIKKISADMFEQCSKLKSIEIPDSVTEIQQSAFFNCSRLEKITIGNGVTSIGSMVFQGCKKLKEITIPHSVKNIGGSLFDDRCKLLQKIQYDGTQDEWRALHKDRYWNGSNVKKVTCLRK